EGNLVGDGQGHLAMTQIAQFGVSDAMAVTTYDDASSMFGANVQVYQDMNTNSIETSDPVVAYDRNPPGGTPGLYMTWIEVGTTNPGITYVVRSHDQGATWDPPVAVSGSDGRDAGFDKPWIAAAAGKVWVTWRASGSIRLAYSGDGGNTWAPPSTA